MAFGAIRQGSTGQKHQPRELFRRQGESSSLADRLGLGAFQLKFLDAIADLVPIHPQ